MAKFYGVIGYVETIETVPGVWTPSVIEREYFGDILRESRYINAGEKVNEDFTVRNRISIIADPYANQHFHSIKYVTWMNSKWVVTAVEVKAPRLNLTIGGIYNGE